MHAALRKALLVSTVGICSLVSAPLGASLIASGPAHPLSTAALADDDDGDDRGGGGGEDRGGRGRDDRGNDDRDHDRGHDDRDHDRGHDDHDDGDRDNDDGDDDDGGDDNRGPGRRDDDDDRTDDASDRPEIELRVSDESLRGLRDGSLIAVDNLGRVLEVEVEFEHGVRVVKVEPHRGDFRRNPGPIDSVTIRPAL